MQAKGPPPTPGSPEEALSHWRNQAINIIILVISLAGLPLVVSTLIKFISIPSQWPVLVSYTVPYLLTISLWFYRPSNTTHRGNWLLVLIYSAGLVDLVYNGLLSSGREYLLAMPILAVILVGVKSGVFASVLSLLTILLVGYLNSHSLIYMIGAIPAQNLPFETWIDSVSMSAFITGCVVLVISLFNRFLFKNLSAQFQVANDLKEINDQLIDEINGHHAADMRFQFQVQRLYALREVDKAITSDGDLQTVLSVILQQILIHLEADSAEITICQPEGAVELKVTDGLKLDAESRIAVDDDPDLSVLAKNKRLTIQVNNPSGIPGLSDARFTDGQKVMAYIAIPLVVNHQVKGLMEVFHRFRIDSSQEWLDFLETLAGQVCIAIEHYALLNSLEKTNLELSRAYDNTLQGWAHAMELRDHETKGHSMRVTCLTLALAEKLGVEGEALNQIRRGALLHDVGKMAIPDKMLLKPDILDPEEWLTMKKHPIYAYDMLNPIEFLRPALAIPRSHHEKWDGSGYPDGLKGEEIPLEARIFAVVDVWDALISERPYKKPWHKIETLDYIRRHSGIYFDPRVVSAFEEIITPELMN